MGCSRDRAEQEGAEPAAEAGVRRGARAVAQDQHEARPRPPDRLPAHRPQDLLPKDPSHGRCLTQGSCCCKCFTRTLAQKLPYTILYDTPCLQNSPPEPNPLRAGLSPDSNFLQAAVH